MKGIEMSGIPHHLPQELITDILLRLPVKPLGRCKCVSKPWRSLLSSPSFVNAHLKLHIHDPEEFIFLDNVDISLEPGSRRFLNILTFTSESRRSEGIARSVNFPKHTKYLGRLGVSDYGLVLLLLTSYEDGCRTILMNPVTLEAVEDLNRPYAWLSAYGMGYDSLKDDYTVVSISDERIVDTYSVKMKKWRRLADFPHSACIFSPTAFLNGRVHFLALSDSRPSNSGWEYVLAAFSLASEEFEETPLPKGVELNELSPNAIAIVVCEGCLAFVYELRDCFIVWVMREYGVQDSWEKLATIMKMPADMNNWDCQFGCLFGCLLGEDEIVLWCDNRFSSYNRRSGAWRKIVVSNYPHEVFLEMRTFRESLLSPVRFTGNL